jgi:hypothetical protein
MSITKLYTLYAVSLDTATLAGSDVLLDQIQSFGVSTGINRVLQRGDGQVDPTYVAVMSQRPGIQFTTTALATALGAAGISGAEIDADETYPGLVSWFQKMDEGGTRASGSSHLKMTAASGILVPRSIQASQDGPATANFEAILTYDGSNEPIVIADSQALAGSPAVGELFTVGPASINGSALEGVQEITIEPGIQLRVASGDGDVWPTYVAIMSRAPSIRIRTTDATALATFGLDGTEQGATDSVVYFRKMGEGGTRVADGTSEHISVTVDDGMVTVENQDVTQDGVAVADVVLTPTYDGSNAIIAISTAAAIS